MSAGGADGSVEVLADAEFADSFCAASNADTVYEYEVEAVRPLSANEGTAVVAMRVPLRLTW